MTERVIWIVLDSVGIGALPDAGRYGDEGSNTLGNIAKFVKGLNLPNLERLGLGNIAEIKGVKKKDNPLASFGKMAEASAGKDTTTGHWEMVGIILETPFPTYPKGFPLDLIKTFEERIGLEVLGNKAASGTEIIAELGSEHMRTGCPIVYTSADSVLQIAAHEDVVPPEKLYEICRIARDLLQGEHTVGRVIARPFIGKPGNFTRTANRHDFSLKPPQPTLLDFLHEAGIEVIAIGKINDIFAGQGISKAIATQDNDDGITKTVEAMNSYQKGLIFVNLVEFDSKYGHRNDPVGYAEALRKFDQRLPEILDCLQNRDLLIITADHGCDPTTISTDHSREYVPLLLLSEQILSGIDLGVIKSFSELGKTVADFFALDTDLPGESMLPLLI